VADDHLLTAELPLVLTEEEQPFWDEQYNNAMNRIMRGIALELRQPSDADIAARCADDAVRLRRQRQGVPIEVIEGDESADESLVITRVTYGRSVELGEFGGFGRHKKKHKKVWFGWEAEVQEGQTEEEVMELLHEKADEQEAREKELFDEEGEESEG
jgi:hypothetical protein